MNGYESMARAAAASGCRCWFASEENELSTALRSALKSAHWMQAETPEQAACMAFGAAAAGECPLLAGKNITPKWLTAMEEQKLSCVVVQLLSAEEMENQEDGGLRLLLPTDGAEAAQLMKEAFFIARSQNVPVVLRMNRTLCEATDETAPKTASELYRQVEQVMNNVGAKLDEAGKKLDEKLSSPEVQEKAEALKKQAEEVTSKAASGIARGAAALADGLGKLVRSFENKRDQDDDPGDDSANG